MVEGAGDITKGNYKKWTKTITKNNYASVKDNLKNKDKEITSFDDMLFNNELVITPSFIGGRNEADYTEKNYQIFVTASVDGTNYENEIPVVAKEEDSDTIKTTNYKDDDGITYSAASILVNGKETTSQVVPETQMPVATPIYNKNATSYNLNNNSSLDDNTVVGYSVGTNFNNTGSNNYKVSKITYFVWDKDKNPILDGTGNQLSQTLTVDNQQMMPSAVFEVKNGTSASMVDDNKNGLYRGNTYYFSYVITYDANGAEKLWPMCVDEKKYSNLSMITDSILASKQKPRIVVYPVISDKNTLTYTYTCTDIDYTLEYASEGNAILNVYSNDVNMKNQKTLLTDGAEHSLILDNLNTTNVTYSTKYNYKVDKAKPYTLETFTKQYFEGIVSGDDITLKSVDYDSSDNNNLVKVVFGGNGAKRIAAVDITLTISKDDGSLKSVTSNLQSVKYENGEAKSEINLLNALIKDGKDNLSEWVKKDIYVTVDAYYDNGKIGYKQGDDAKYFAYTDVDNKYFMLDAKNNFVYADGIQNNMFESTSTFDNDKVKLSLKSIDQIEENLDGNDIELLYSGNGLKKGDNVIIPKGISKKEIESKNSIRVNDLRIGVEITGTDTTITTATILLDITNPLNKVVDKYIVELLPLDSEKAKADWSKAQSIDIGNTLEKDKKIILDNLKAATFYKMRIKYISDGQEIYTYDIKSKNNGEEYSFETLATIGISDIKLTYNVKSYMDKTFKITYNINKDRSTMYDKVKYVFYDGNGKNQIKLTESNIYPTNGLSEDQYSISDGALIVNNPKNEEKGTITENISMSPSANVFTVGNKYILKIIPIVTYDGKDIELQEGKYTFTYKKFTNPEIGLKFKRTKKVTNDKEVNYIYSSITINDVDGVIVGSNYGEYKIKIYRYSGEFNEKDATPIKFYDKYSGGNDITDKTFNINKNAKNFMVYVHPEDVDSKYSYRIELTYQYDYENKGTDESIKENKISSILRAYSSDLDISTGNPQILKNGNNVELRFYGDVSNINKITKIEYSVASLQDNVIKQSDSYTPDIKQMEDTDAGISYYCTTTPIQITDSGKYLIRLNLYANSSGGKTQELIQYLEGIV